MKDITAVKEATETMLVNTLSKGSVKEVLKEIIKTGDSASNMYTVDGGIVLMNMLGLLGYK